MTALIMTADKIGFPGIAAWFKKLAEKLEHRRQVRSTIKQLNRLTDRELHDIGISRGDIYAIANYDQDYVRVRAQENKNLEGWV